MRGRENKNFRRHMKDSLLNRPEGHGTEPALVWAGLWKEHAGMCEYSSVNTP